MTNNASSIFIFISFVTAAVFLTLGCESPTGENGDKTGTIDLYCFSEALGDPSQITEGYQLYSLVQVSPEINDTTLIQTDAQGYTQLKAVPEGSYTFTPLHAADSYAKSVTVTAGQTEQVELPTPLSGIYMYMFDTESTSPPFDDIQVRQALAMSLVRNDLVTSLEEDNDLDLSTDLSLTNTIQPCGSFIPSVLASDDWTYDSVAEDISTAESYLIDTNAFDFTLHYNSDASNSNFHDDMADHVIAQWGALSKIGIITQTSEPMSSYITNVGSAIADMWAAWWYLDSNNLYLYFEAIFNGDIFMDIDDAEFETHLENVGNAINDQDIDTYEQEIIEVNNRLIELMPAVPLLCFE